MWNYLFEIVNEENEYCGELFFIQCDNLAEAYRIAFDLFEVERPHDLHFWGKYTDEEAEAMGCDTY